MQNRTFSILDGDFTAYYNSRLLFTKVFFQIIYMAVIIIVAFKINSMSIAAQYITLVKFIAAAVIIANILTIITALRKAFEKDPAIAVSSAGVLVNTDFFGRKIFVNLQAIEKVEVKRVKGGKYVVVLRLNEILAGDKNAKNVHIHLDFLSARIDEILYAVNAKLGKR